VIRVHLKPRGAYWLCRWRESGRPRSRCLGRVTNIAAEQAEVLRANIEVEVNAGRVEQVPRTVEQWLEAFLGLRPGLSEKSAGLYRACGERLAGFLGANIALGDVTPLRAMEFSAWLTTQHGLAAQTVFRIMSECRAVFQAAVDADLLVKNPFSKAVPAKPKPDQTWHYVTLDELEKLLAVAPGRWRCLLGLIRLAGLRQNEALRLKWSGVDLVGRRITVCNPGQYQTTKKRVREVPIELRLHDLLFEASMSGDVTERVCQGMAAGSIHREFLALCEKAGVNPWEKPCQACRKSLETDWAGKHPLHTVTSWLGNSPTVALRHYLKPTDADFDRASGPRIEKPALDASMGGLEKKTQPRAS